jgi:hypothetical protein
MSANYQTASGTAGWRALAPTLLPPRDFGVTAAVSEARTTVLLRVRQLLEMFKGIWRQQAGGGGDPETSSEDHPEGDSIWDDPVLWTLIMMH